MKHIYLRAFLSAVALVVMSNGSALAGCIKLNSNTKTFTNKCSFLAYVEYTTRGGGCFQGANNVLRFTIERNERKTFPLLSQQCGSSSSWKTHWGWCDWEKWRNGDCKPK